MSFTPGDVVVVPFPYSDALAEKRRPAVVVSSPQLERDHGLVWLVMVTSTAKARQGDVAINDLQATGLPVPCTVRPAKIACVDVRRIQGRLGALRSSEWRGVRASLARYWGGRA